MNPTLFARRASLAATALLALLLAGCGIHIRHLHHPGGGMVPYAADPANPLVRVDARGRLSVNQEPLRFYKAQGAVTITWRLPPDGRYSFPQDGIVVEGQVAAEEFRCGPGAQAHEFICLNRNSRPGDYKYTVRALQDGKPLPALDPRIINEFD